MDSLDGITTFVSIVDAGSITAAARQLGTPKSTVSRRLARLEDRLGVQLLARTTRRLNLTNVGQAFYDRCRQIVAELYDAEQAVASATAKPRGNLRASFPPSSGNTWVTGLLTSFLRAHLEVTIEARFEARYVNLVEEGIDVAVRAGTLEDSSLIARKLQTTRLLVLASPEYLQEHGEPRQPEDLARHACLVGASSARRWRAADGRSFEVRGRLVADDVGAVQQAAVEGMGLALLPSVACADDLAAGRLVPVLQDHFHSEAGLFIVYPPGRHLSPTVRAFVDHAVAYLDQHWPSKDRP
jgi:DNA-binding transcriptional LysR family regulator